MKIDPFESYEDFREQIKIKRLYNDATIPKYAKNGDAAMDLHAYLPEGAVVIYPGETKLIKCGVSLSMPKGMVAMICPRSGLALKESITVLNGPGIIDPQFRGEWGVILINHAAKKFEIKNNDRIAQAMFVRFESVNLVEVYELDVTDRNVDGFGSTGV